MPITISGDSPSFSGSYQGGVLTADTAKASTSGTTVDFTGIPSWVKRITVMFQGVSTNGTQGLIVQIGTGGTATASGYDGFCTSNGGTNTAFTTGFPFANSVAAANVFSGAMTIENVSGNTWVARSTVSVSGGSGGRYGAGILTLAGTLNFLRVTTSNGADAFDAGSINIMYE